MSTAGQKFMTELSTRTINAAAPSSSGTEDSLEILRLFKDDYLSADEALHGITENVRGVAQAAPDLENLANRFVGIIQDGMAQDAGSKSIASIIINELLMLRIIGSPVSSTNRVCAHPHCSCPPNARCLA